jgi:cytoskeletal protein CcmA (bactofilin family)
LSRIVSDATAASAPWRLLQPNSPKESTSMLKTFMHPGNTKTGPTRPSHPARDQSGQAGAGEPARTEAPPEMAPATSVQNGSQLIVGPNIKLKGSEITDCEILVVEGRVEAAMNSRDIRIAEGGVFSGKAEIDLAEVRGIFEGELIARKRLVIHATGKVTGLIRYGALMIEEGGTLSGDVARLPVGGPGTAVAADDARQEMAPGTLAEKAAGLEVVHSTAAFARSQGLR